MKLGWLSPSGEFIECGYWEHLAIAHELVEKYYTTTIVTPNIVSIPSNTKITPDDDLLLENGWVYIGISSFGTRELRIGWKKFLTEHQKYFLKPYFEQTEIDINSVAKLRWDEENE